MRNGSALRGWLWIFQLDLRRNRFIRKRMMIARSARIRISQGFKWEAGAIMGFDIAETSVIE